MESLHNGAAAGAAGLEEPWGGGKGQIPAGNFRLSWLGFRLVAAVRGAGSGPGVMCPELEVPEGFPSKADLNVIILCTMQNERNHRMV